MNVVYGSALLRALMGKAGVAAVGSAARLGPFFIGKRSSSFVHRYSPCVWHGSAWFTLIVSNLRVTSRLDRRTSYYFLLCADAFSFDIQEATLRS